MGFEQFEIRTIEVEKQHVHPVDPLLVDEWGVEQFGVAGGESGGVIGRDPGVMETHTGRSAGNRINGGANTSRSHHIPDTIIAFSESRSI